MPMSLNQLLPAAGSSVLIRELTLDSRKVRPGDLFLAVPGTQQDGRVHIADAIARGAAAVAFEAEGAAPMHADSAVLVPVKGLAGVRWYVGLSVDEDKAFAALRESPALWWSFLYFFCLLSGYYVLRPVREAMAASSDLETVFPPLLIGWFASHGIAQDHIAHARIQSQCMGTIHGTRDQNVACTRSCTALGVAVGM